MRDARGRGRRALAAAIAGAAAVSAGAACANAEALQVTVENVHGTRGHVRVDVCTAQTFLGDCAISGEAPAQTGETIVLLPEVPPGDYAIQAYQDVNDDHEVNRNRFGIPTEGFGFSHDASFSLGPPKFKHARFRVDDRPLSVRVKLHYLPH